MDAPSKGKPGPKKGWLDKMHADLADYKDEADYLRSVHLRVASQRMELQHRVNNFNIMPLWRKLLFILRGGHV